MLSQGMASEDYGYYMANNTFVGKSWVPHLLQHAGLGAARGQSAPAGDLGLDRVVVGGGGGGEAGRGHRGREGDRAADQS